MEANYKMVQSLYDSSWRKMWVQRPRIQIDGKYQVAFLNFIVWYVALILSYLFEWQSALRVIIFGFESVQPDQVLCKKLNPNYWKVDESKRQFLLDWFPIGTSDVPCIGGLTWHLSQYFVFKP
jgi:hypothetical protein